MSLVVTQGRYI